VCRRLSSLNRKTRGQNTGSQPDGPSLLRGLSCFYLSLLPCNYFGLGQYGNLRSLGSLGVSVFYVLSGFVLYLNYPPEKTIQGTRFPFLSFYVSRFARIYPAFLLTTLLAIPLEVFSPTKTGFWEPFLMTLGMVHCFQKSACWRFNDVGWSLSVEAFFYAVFPFLLIACFPLSLKRISAF
jgi:peptidoglycan/LPS O-acetylase OafA/YrhL